MIGQFILTLRANDVHVKVRQPRGHRQRHVDHLRRRDHVLGEVVEEGAVLVVVGHQPQLRPGAVVCG